MIANQNDIFSQRKYSTLDIELERGRERERGSAAHLISSWLVCGHMSLQLSAVTKRVATQRAGEVLLVFLVPVLDVFL